jgi:hypothetical protein
LQPTKSLPSGIIHLKVVFYLFALLEDPSALVKCDVPKGATVLEVKLSLSVLRHQEELLVGAMSMLFRGTELLDDNPIVDYGIPAMSLINATVNPTESMSVFDNSGHRKEYQFGEQDTIGSLLAALEFKGFATQGAVMLGDGSEQESSKLLKELKSLNLHFLTK